MSDYDCRRVCDLLSAYIDGELAEDERRNLETHLDNCLHCRVYLKSLNFTVNISSRLEGHKPYEMPQEVRTKLRAFLRERCMCGDKEKG
ncbi:MAG: zf-HC2 domain-containing protein [Deltaproteobacteria bacterium]|uniref:Zf-HC2 domain-containing protein n=1 Tax=Candidatus Zymogenus saltonus TaxID=2844893 RepID=A0A9D8KF55_9DELT|nr:zf-HC2 domain-containing protein [Candidatus Zymogenus saltonus]